MAPSQSFVRKGWEPRGVGLQEMQEDACGRVMAGEAPHACEAACGGPSLEEKKQARRKAPLKETILTSPSCAA